MFNILFLTCFMMEDYLKKLLKYRYFMIDFFILPIAGGLIGMIVLYIKAKNAVESPTSLTYAEYLDY